MREVGYRIGMAGGVLGIVAGIVQLGWGDVNSDWMGNKLHPVQLGIITILLSVIALAGVSFLARRADAPMRERVLATILIGLAAGICFTTVGRLWYVPGPLLIVAAVLLNQGARTGRR